jgi:hypothetical protein
MRVCFFEMCEKGKIVDQFIDIEDVVSVYVPTALQADRPTTADKKIQARLAP